MEYISFLFDEKRALTYNALIISVCVFFWILIAILLIKWIAGFFAVKVKKKVQDWRSLSQILANISWFSCIIFPLFIASLWLPFSGTVRIVLAVLFIIAVGIEISALLKYLLNFVMEKWFRWQDAKTKKNLGERYKAADELYDDLQELSKKPEVLKDKRSFIARLFSFK